MTTKPYIRRFYDRHDVEIWLAITLFISISFGTYLSMMKVTDPFLYYDTGFSKSVIRDGSISFPDTGQYASLNQVPGRPILMIQLINIMGITPEELQFLPIGSIFLSVTFFLVAQSITKSPFISSLLTVYLVLNMSHATALYSVFAYAFGLPMFLGFVFLCNMYLRKKTTSILALLLLLFLSLNLIHYTLSVWMILYVLGASGVILYQKFLRNYTKEKLQVPPLPLTLAFVVFFFTFNKTLYNSYIPNIAPEILDTAIQRFFAYFIFAPEDAIKSPYVYTRSEQVNLIGTVTLIAILVPVIIGFILEVRDEFKKTSKDKKVDLTLTYTWALLFLGFIDAFAYSIRGSISTKTFSLLFPIIAVRYCTKFNRSSLAYLLAVFLVVTSIGKIVIYSNNSFVLQNNQSTYKSLEPSAKWIEKNIAKDNYYLLSDMDMYGKYLVLSENSSTGRTPLLQPFDANMYEKIVDGRTSVDYKKRFPDIVAIDLRSNQQVTGFFWRAYAPLNKYLGKIEISPSIDILYNDGTALLAKIRGTQ